MLRNKKFLLFISLLVAIGLWMYVMGNVDPVTVEKASGLKVEMQGVSELEKQGLHPTLKSPKIVGITIEGKRSEVNKAKKKGIEAYVDVTTCNYGLNEGRVQIRIPDGVTGVSVESISNDRAIFRVK